jgi:hypothetical protein
MSAFVHFPIDAGPEVASFQSWLLEVIWKMNKRCVKMMSKFALVVSTQQQISSTQDIN